MGHSEGALVAAMLGAAAIQAGHADRFATVVLSGFPVEGLKAAMLHQGVRRPEKALARQRRAEAADLAGSLKRGPGLGAETMAQWWALGDARAPVSTLLKARVPVLVQHGVDDSAVPVAWINRWEREWNAPWLVIQLFNGGHSGSLGMLASQAVWVDQFVGLDPSYGFVGGYRNQTE